MDAIRELLNQVVPEGRQSTLIADPGLSLGSTVDADSSSDPVQLALLNPWNRTPRNCTCT